MHPGLTSFRALAFLGVFLFHMKLFGAGYLGVQAFFVLSGFLLTPILLDMKSSLNPRQFFLHFYGRRALRIFPLYYGYLFAASAIIYTGSFDRSAPEYQHLRSFVEQLPFSFTYTYNFFHASDSFQHTRLATHLWSLSIEEQFYLLWPLVIFLAPPRWVKPVLIATVVAGPLLRALTAWVGASGSIAGLSERVDLVVYVLPFSYLDAFAIGGLFALVRPRFGNLSLAALFVATVLLGYFTELQAVRLIQLDGLGYLPFMTESYKYVWGYTLWNLLFAIILVKILNDELFPAVMRHPALVYLGKISYGLYLFHYPVLFIMASQVPQVTRLTATALVFLATVLVSAASYELFESRFIALKDRWFARRDSDELAPTGIAVGDGIAARGAAANHRS